MSAFLSKLLLGMGLAMAATLPPIWTLPYIHWALYLTYGGWPLLLTLPVSLMKFLVFPFFIPFIFAWCIYLFVKLDTVGRAAFAAFLAMQASVFYQMEERRTADVGAWGLRGPCKDCPIPSLGVWYFQGLPGAGFIDFSHCEWTGDGGVLTPASTAYCHMPGLISYPLEGYNILAEQARLNGAKHLDITADFGSAGAPVEAFYDIAPWYANMGLLFYHLFAKNRLDFHFNEKGDEAIIFENICLLDTGLCTAMTGATYFRTLMMHLNTDGLWDRATYFNEAGFAAPTFAARVLGLFSCPPIWAASRKPRCGGTTFPTLPLVNGDGYRLAPVLLPGKALHMQNMKKAASVAPTLVVRKSWRGSVLPPP